MMRKESRLITERIGRVISMGGALDVPGNTSPVAECKLIQRLKFKSLIVIHF